MWGKEVHTEGSFCRRKEVHKEANTERRKEKKKKVQRGGKENERNACE